MTEHQPEGYGLFIGCDEVKEKQGKRIGGADVPLNVFADHTGDDDLAWAEKLLDGLPEGVKAALFKNYVKRRSGNGKPRSANIGLRNSVEHLKRTVAQFPVDISELITDKKREAIAQQWALICDQIKVTVIKEMESGKETKEKDLLKAVLRPAISWGFSPTVPDLNADEWTEDQKVVALGAVLRLIDANWWKRKIKKAFARYEEHCAIIAGKVRKGVSPYLSHHATLEYLARRRANRIWLESMLAVNDVTGEEIPLADAVKASVANPENRRNEFMVRMSGFQELAKEMGLDAEFYTATAPSKFHAWRTMSNGKTVYNEKYEGASPSQTQKYLVKCWAKARAKLARKGLRVFGFRICEPHHDGTPHWHILLFIKPEEREEVRNIIGHYFLEEDREELKNETSRFDWKYIDPEKGSAVGYIAKYISKNIDGHKVDFDYEAEDLASTTTAGVVGWASLWNIRQFQQVGGPSVTVWRELRRLESAIEDKVVEAVRAAADAAAWDRYVKEMGGIHLMRKFHKVVLVKKHLEETGSYGEPGKKLKGVAANPEVCTPLATLISRPDDWVIKSAKADALDLGPLSDGNRAPWRSGNNCTEVQESPEKDKDLAKKLDISESDLAQIKQGRRVATDSHILELAANGAGVVATAKPIIGDPDGYQDQWLNEREKQAEKELKAKRIRLAQKYVSNPERLDKWLTRLPEHELEPCLAVLEDVVEQHKAEAAMLASYDRRNGG